MTTHTLTAADLLHFTGSVTWFRHHLARTVSYTEGVRYMAEHGGAYWLIDEIALANSAVSQVAAVRAQPFQRWKLTRAPEGHAATLTADDGNGNLLWRKDIPYTDFPLPEITLFVADGGPHDTRVIMLPTEY